MKVLVSDSMSEVGVEVLREAGIEVDVNTGLKPEEIKAIIGNYEGLLVRSATKVTPELLAAADKLKPSPGPAPVLTTSTFRLPQKRVWWS